MAKVIALRLNDEEEALFLEASKRSHLKLSTWIKQTLKQAIYEGEEVENSKGMPHRPDGNDI